MAKKDLEQLSPIVGKAFRRLNELPYNGAELVGRIENDFDDHPFPAHNSCEESLHYTRGLLLRIYSAYQDALDGQKELSLQLSGTSTVLAQTQEELAETKQDLRDKTQQADDFKYMLENTRSELAKLKKELQSAKGNIELMRYQIAQRDKQVQHYEGVVTGRIAQVALIIQRLKETGIEPTADVDQLLAELLYIA